jgi:hypothetical protein
MNEDQEDPMALLRILGLDRSASLGERMMAAPKTMAETYGTGAALKGIGQKITDSNALNQVARSLSGALPSVAKGLRGLGPQIRNIGMRAQSPQGVIGAALLEQGVMAIPNAIDAVGRYKTMSDWDEAHPFYYEGKTKTEYDMERKGFRINYETGEVFDKSGRLQGYLGDPWSEPVKQPGGQMRRPYTPMSKRNKDFQIRLESQYGRPDIWIPQHMFRKKRW